MKDIEHVFLECMETERFHDVIEDDFSFADSLINNRDIDRVFNKEEE